MVAKAGDRNAELMILLLKYTEACGIMKGDKMKRVRMLAVLSVIAMLLSFSSMAQAAQARGRIYNADTNSFDETIGGYRYIFAGSVSVDNDRGAWAGAAIINQTNPKANVPNGYVKISCYLYDATGALIKSAASPYSGLGPWAPNALIIETGISNIPDDYYASARALIYNPATGNYVTWNTINSPRLTYDPTSALSTSTKMSLARSQPTNDAPGWIPAVATNGLKGVIKEADLLSDFPQSPAIASLMPSADRTINVYAPGSNAVIGQFIEAVG